MSGIIDPFGKVQVVGERYKPIALSGEAVAVGALRPTWCG